MGLARGGGGLSRHSSEQHGAAVWREEKGGVPCATGVAGMEEETLYLLATSQQQVLLLASSQAGSFACHQQAGLLPLIGGGEGENHQLPLVVIGGESYQHPQDYRKEVKNPPRDRRVSSSP
ncbi:hypothetical protein HGM15179_017535 [Zosterops borbonicus]|uniref:Uncharacterized protein n=1 Tax=Zosterops borbonicus TaxID=364589 RepID=A0A8K1LD91_9PASS|nr:hypothetical protein HGM15179_017535 [Zosterops borbonicus]